MGSHATQWPLFATAKTSARLLDMPERDFLRLVTEGALPGPIGLNRWDVSQIEAVMRGHKPKPTEDFDL